MKNAIKTIVLTTFIALSSTLSFAQLGTQRIETRQFHKKADSEHFKYVDMDFNSAAIQNQLSHIDAEEVQSISLVYTQYRQSERFDQLALNTSRTDLLLKQFPKFKNPGIKWYWVAQTGCNDPETCHDYFHGFEIRLKTKTETLAAIRADHLLKYYIDHYKGIDKSEVMDSIISVGASSLVKKCDTVVKEDVYRSTMGMLQATRQTSKKLFLEQLKIYKIVPDNIVTIETDGRNRVVNMTGVSHQQYKRFLAILKRFYRFRPSRFERQPVHTFYELRFTTPRGVYYRDFSIQVTPLDTAGDAIVHFEDRKVVTKTETCYYVDTSMAAVYGSVPDKVVTEVFERNRQWKNCLVVTDVTGSMYPYMAQFLLWHQQNLDKRSGNHDFVFFNDGDNLPDDLKKVGRVGGVYYKQTANYDSLQAKMTIAMTSGGGGDGPENNLEAIIYGLKQNPHCKEVILVADNWATPRDMELLKLIKVPVHVILCGATSMNMEYINIAKQTKGSIHTIEHDLYNLDKVKFHETGGWITMEND